MSKFGLGLGGIQTSSSVADTQEARDYRESVTAQEDADKIQTGLGAIPGAIKDVGKTAAEVVKAGAMLNDRDTLSQVLGEAQQLKLLSDAEMQMLTTQLSQGNTESVSNIMAKLLPGRRYDSKAVELIQAQLMPEIMDFRKAEAQLKGRVAPGEKEDGSGYSAAKAAIDEKRAKVKAKIEQMLLENDQGTAEALKARLKDIGFDSEGGKKSSRMTELEYMYNRKEELERLKAREAAAAREDKDKKDKAKGQRKISGKLAEESIKQGVRNLDEANEVATVLQTTVNQLAGDGTKNNPGFVDENGDLDLVGFTPKYLTTIGNLSETTKGENMSEAERQEYTMARRQQSIFLNLLNQYMKAMSGAAVTAQEAYRLLGQFGLQKFANEIIPESARNNDNIFDKEQMGEFITSVLQYNSQFMTPQNVLDGMTYMAQSVNERLDKNKAVWAGPLREDDSTALKNMYNTAKLDLDRLPTTVSPKLNSKYYNTAADIDKVMKIAERQYKDILGDLSPSPAGNGGVTEEEVNDLPPLSSGGTSSSASKKTDPGDDW